MKELKIKSTNWNLELLNKGKSFEEKRKDFVNATDKFILKWKNTDDYLENPEKLKEVLDDYEKWMNFYAGEVDEFYYYRLKNETDQNNPELKAKLNHTEEFSRKIQSKIEFFVLKISKIKKDKQKSFLKNPLLKNYKHFLERIFAGAKYRLSENEEKIISLKSKTSYSAWAKMLSGFLSSEEREVLDENGKIKVKNFSEITNLMNSKNKKVRDRAAKIFNDILGKYKELAENEINAILQDKKVDDELRGYSRPDDSRHLSEDMESETVDIIVEAIKKRFDISKKYYELKAKLLGLKKLEYHERNVEYGEVNEDYSYEKAVNIAYDIFNKTDEGFGNVLKDFVENSKIDVFPKKGKRGGAFCTRQAKSQPIYIFLNYTNNLTGIKSLVHELGHAINAGFIRKKQNSLNFGNYKSVAEVASKFTEEILFEELINNADEELKLNLIIQKLNIEISSIMTQVACELFQRELHKTFREKGYLSYKEIGKIFQKHMSAYMGEFVEQSKGSENWWIPWHHIRLYFYNYQYSSGLLIAKFMQKKVRENPRFIEEVKEFLSSGTSDSPKNIFLKMGIDISSEDFWNSGLNEVENLLNEAKSLAKKLGKIK